jgi:MFS superfamily sulfate permease-like transporter
MAHAPEASSPALRFDVIAGLTAAAVVLPKAMAYATVAGLPVSVGLRIPEIHIVLVDPQEHDLMTIVPVF